jgi:hypothetical protein
LVQILLSPVFLSPRFEQLKENLWCSTTWGN